MLAKVSALMAAVVAVALVAAALWGWGVSRQAVARADNPQMALWAIRSGAIAAIAAAQVLGLTFVVGAFGRHGDSTRAGEVMRLLAGFVCTAAIIGALTMGMMSR